MAVLSGSGLISSAVSGLTNAYSILATQNENGTGLTVSNLTNPSSTVISQLGNNTTFLSYLINNFGTMDKDGDGIISSNELSQLTSTMQGQGLTKDEIANLCTNTNSTLYQTVSEYFDKIDTNNDGRVTEAEIKAFSYKSQRQHLDTQYNGVKASKMSLYYADENADDKTSSIVDGLYPDLNSSGS